MRPTWADIDLDAIASNVATIADLVAPAEVCAVVKAGGYEHGSVPVSRAAVEAGATWLAVALVQEGKVLRDAGVTTPILVLSEPRPLEMVEVVAYGYPWINWLSHLRVWLARRTLAEREDWDQEKQTAMSNHRQIPSWLSGSLAPLLVNRVTVWPLAVISRLFNRVDLSDGYILTARK